MCGIAVVTGPRPALPIIIAGKAYKPRNLAKTVTVE